MLRKINTCIILCLLLIFILIFILNIFVKPYIEHFQTTDKNIWAITFGGGSKNYYDAALRFENELVQVNIFNKVINISDSDLKNDPEFWDKHRTFIENNKRGYGYWIWKPYIIMKTLETMNTNDILLYADSGCEVVISDQTRDKMNNIFNKCNDYEMLYTYTGYKEINWDKMDLIDFMNMKNDSNSMNSQQHQASMIIMKKTDKVVNFINEWYKIASDYHLIDDTPSMLKNDKNFVEHRHDQSIFSLLTKSEKYKFNDENNVIKENDINIIISRKIDR